MIGLEKQINKLPLTPGVYLFKRGRQILYIGKATSLRSRVRSYWRADLATTRSEWIAKMIGLIKRIAFITTDSVLEALILESAQIKKHQPPYNVRDKDDKSFLFVGLTQEDFPRLITFRESELRDRSKNFAVFTRVLAGSDADQNFSPPLRSLFGPFPHGAELREALKIIRKIFPYSDEKCRLPVAGRPVEPCFNFQIGLCPGVCIGAVTKSDYARTIRHITLFFQGKKSRLIKQLEREMAALARQLKFEAAAQVKKQIWSLKHIQDVALIKERAGRVEGGGGSFKIEAYDVAHLSGTNTVGVMVVMENGELAKNEYRQFKLRGKSAQKSDDTGNLREVLERRLKHHEWPEPDLIVVDGGMAQVNLAKQVLQTHALNLPVVGVVKDEHHRARELRAGNRQHSMLTVWRDQIIKLNAEAHRFALTYHRRLRRQLKSVL